MPLNVLFVYPMWTSDYKGISGYFAKRSGGTFPPLNLAMLASITENSGHTAQIIDAELERLSHEQLIKKVLAISPDIVAVTGMTPFFHIIEDFCSSLKEQGFSNTICVGGPHVTIMEEKALRDYFDFLFIGEGEETWPKFLNTLANNKNFENCPGIIYQDKGIVKKNDRIPADKNLDIYPSPAYHLLKVGQYKMGTMRGRLNFFTIQTIRGCPWKCIFCASDKLDTTRISKVSIQRVVDDIEEMANKYDVKHFLIVDDVLTLVKKRITEFCNEIIKRNLEITFEGSTRANLLDNDIVKLMAKAGLIRISFGLETVDEDMRKTMNKKVPLDAYIEANQILNRHGVECLNSVMIGLPGETVENVHKTLDFLKSSKEIKQANFAIAVPYPGTKFHDMAISGKHGVQIVDADFKNYKRYGNSVTQVNGLSANDLVKLQNEGFVSIYSRYWRWMPVFKRNGIIGLLLTFYRLLTVIFSNDRLLVKRHPSLD